MTQDVSLGEKIEKVNVTLNYSEFKVSLGHLSPRFRREIEREGQRNGRREEQNGGEEMEGERD